MREPRLAITVRASELLENVESDIKGLFRRVVISMPRTTPRTAERKRARIKTCFIAAPWDVDLTFVKAVLRERGIEPIVALELRSQTDSLLEHLRSAITRADLFLAILPAETQRQNILFELGYAYGLKKQVLIMAPPGASLPFDVHELQYIRADAQNREALGFALDQALAAKRTAPPKKPSIVETHALGDNVDSLLARLRAASRPGLEAELMDIVARAIEESGASTVVERGPSAQGFDIAVWADELGPWIGNPLLIEIKRMAPSKELVLKHLVPRVQANQSRWALLLYQEGDRDHVRATIGRVPFVLVLSIDEFLRELRHKSFAEIVIHLRNEWVHSGVR